MRVATDGFLDTRDGDWVRLPGETGAEPEPLPEREALSFLLSHSFPGARRIVRCLTPGQRGTLQRAVWAESVNTRMNLVDRVWRAITEPASVKSTSDKPQLLQIVLYGTEWAYPVYLENGVVRVAPRGGLPVGEIKKKRGTPRIDLRSAA